MTKAEIVWVRSLHDKRGRMAAGFFVAEGRKAVEDLLTSGLEIAKIYSLESYEETIRAVIEIGGNCGVRSVSVTDHNGDTVTDVEIISPKDMERISLMKSPSEVVAIVEIPRHDIDMDQICDKLSLVLDGVQDPGNLGTIIRLADWFGIENVVCSPDSVDCFNPKVVQATMGAIARVKVHYLPLVPFLEGLSGSQTTPTLPIYGTFLDGDIIYDTTLSSRGLIVMGSEGRGISSEIEPFITYRLFIPPFPVGVPTSESLNVAVATSIVCSEFRRGVK